MDSRAKRLVEIGDGLFSALQPWNTMRQELAELFYPMRADFTTDLTPGTDFQSNLMDSYTVQARETLGNMPHAMLRQGDWFNVSTGNDERDELPSNMDWFDKTKEAMRNFIYAPRANFTAATIEADHDWVTIGNPVLSAEENIARDGLLYRAWHPRDCAWMMDGDGQIDHVQRTLMMTARNIVKRWPECHKTIKTASEKEPNKAFKLRHILMPVDDIYGEDKKMRRKYQGKPHISIYVDCENQEMLGESGKAVFNYVVPRWRTLSNISIGFSPATINCLPDGRMLQDLARIILDSGEKAIDPPTVAKGEMFRDAVNLYAGGMTYVDLEDDEKIQDKMMTLDNRGQIGFGLEMKQDVRTLIAESFLLNKLMLPKVHEMTAFETQARLDEFRRAALPFFGPIESEYHLKLLDVTFETLIANKAIPAPPKELEGTDITFKFEGPLNTLEGRQVIAAYQESLQIVAASAQFDQTVAKGYDFKKATRDAVRGAGAKPDWFVDEETLKATEEADNQAAELAKAAELANAGGMTAQNVGAGAQALQQAGLVP